MEKRQAADATISLRPASSRPLDEDTVTPTQCAIMYLQINKRISASLQSCRQQSALLAPTFEMPQRTQNGKRMPE